MPPGTLAPPVTMRQVHRARVTERNMLADCRYEEDELAPRLSPQIKHRMLLRSIAAVAVTLTLGCADVLVPRDPLPHRPISLFAGSFVARMLTKNTIFIVKFPVPTCNPPHSPLTCYQGPTHVDLRLGQLEQISALANEWYPSCLCAEHLLNC